MHRNRPVSPTFSLALIRTLRSASVVAAILMMIAFFAGCESAKSTSQGDDGIMRTPDNGHAMHGEVGAMYGRSG